MHIQVIAPNVDTKFTNQPNTLALLDETLRNTRAQNAVHRKRAGYGTPMRLTRAKIFGAWPWTARPYRVRVPMYKSEFAAERTKMRIAALMIWFRTLIPASVVAVGAARKRMYGHGHDIERTHDERRGRRWVSAQMDAPRTQGRRQGGCEGRTGPLVGGLRAVSAVTRGAPWEGLEVWMARPSCAAATAAGRGAAWRRSWPAERASRRDIVVVDINGGGRAVGRGRLGGSRDWAPRAPVRHALPPPLSTSASSNCALLKWLPRRCTQMAKRKSR